MSIVTYSQLGRNGRLGNQMFQIAATIAYGIEHGKWAVFPKWDYSRFMKYPLNEGECQYPVVHREPAFTFSEIPAIEGNVDLHGYFQSEKYFSNFSDHIRRIFRLSDEHEKIVKEWFLNRINSHQGIEHTCSIHVRRGDYEKNEHTKAFHGLLGMDYYQAAVRLIKYPAEQVLFFIVSDDPDWCEKNFGWLPNKVVSRNSEIMDLYMQAYCTINIIANSSFSWWGHWLNQHPDKICIAPKNWFANGPDSQDIYLPNTIKI